MKASIIETLTSRLTHIISETNGLTLLDTIDLLNSAQTLPTELKKEIHSFKTLLDKYRVAQADIENLMDHPVGQALFQFFRNFPLRFREEHIHLTGSLTAEFIFPRLKKLIEGPDKEVYIEKLRMVYGDLADNIESVDDVNQLIRLHDGEMFDRYLEILLVSKLILVDRQAHKEAAFHLAKSLWDNYNVGSIRLKFTL